MDESAASQEDASGDERQGVLCSTCRARITGEDQALSIQDRHRHAFFNPAGIAFEIRCFQTAPGTVVQGASSTEFSWFADHAWQVALCATCRTHLGWRFTGQTGASAFYGLIVARLASP